MALPTNFCNEKAMATAAMACPKADEVAVPVPASEHMPTTDDLTTDDYHPIIITIIIITATTSPTTKTCSHLSQQPHHHRYRRSCWCPGVMLRRSQVNGHSCVTSNSGEEVGALFRGDEPSRSQRRCCDVTASDNSHSRYPVTREGDRFNLGWLWAAKSAGLIPPWRHAFARWLRTKTAVRRFLRLHPLVQAKRSVRCSMPPPNGLTSSPRAARPASATTCSVC